MSKDVKPLTPTKRTKPYTIKELAALKDAQGPRAESLLNFLGVQATVEAFNEARADNAALLGALAKCNEVLACRGFDDAGDADEKALNNHWCSACDEYVDRNGPVRRSVRLALAQPHPGSALLERLKKAEEERDEALAALDVSRSLGMSIEPRQGGGVVWAMRNARAQHAEAEADAYRQRVGIEEAARGESEKLLRIIAAERDAAEARVKELEEALKECLACEEAHEQMGAAPHLTVIEAARAALSTPKVKP